MKKFLLSLFSLFALVGIVNAETYTHEFAKGDFALTGGNTTLGDYAWTSTGVALLGDVNAKGLQIGDKDNPVRTFTLTTSAFDKFIINSITVNTSTAANAVATMKISVGSTNETFTLKSLATDYTLTCDKATGNIVISWEQPETNKALYVKSIIIDYALPASMVEVATPVFKTPEGIYPDEVAVEAETATSNAGLYYTIDGSEPSYEDYQAGGSTMRSGYYVMYKKITSSATVKVIAVLEDGGQVYSSSVAEATYIIEPSVAYVLADKVISGKSYGIIAGDTIAVPATENAESGSLNAVKATKGNGCYKSIDDNAFTVTEANGGYTIQDSYGRYLYMKNDGSNNFYFADEQPASGAVWSISFDNNMYATVKNTLSSKVVYYSIENAAFACYSATEATESMILPKMYLMGQFPEYTITPAAGEEVETFQKITITSPTGIKAADNLVVNYNYQKNMTVVQVDDNTLEISLDAPVTTKDNMTVFIYFTGAVMLDPNGINVPMDIAKNRLMYTITGEAPPATIVSVTPSDNSKVESLSYFLFAFTKICVKNDDATIVPLLYKEGTTDYIAVEFTTDKEDGSGKVKMDEAAIKVSEKAVIENGTYILEIPKGYFIDSNGREVAATTLKYTVENDFATAVESVDTEKESLVVYSVSGTRMNVASLNNLPKGLYIVNGVKTFVK